MLPPAVKKNVVWSAVMWSRKPPSRCAQTVAPWVGSAAFCCPSVLGS